MGRLREGWPRWKNSNYLAQGADSWDIDYFDEKLILDGEQIDKEASLSERR